MRFLSDRTTLYNQVMIIKVTSLLTLGPIVAIGHIGFNVAGGLLGCPFPIPFMMCQACPVTCIFGVIRPWLFGSIVTTSLLTGRIWCGILCPFGIVYDFLFKLPIKKKFSPKKNGTKIRYVKYGVLLLFYYLMFEVANVLLETSSVTGTWSLMSIHLEEVKGIIFIAVLIAIISSIYLYRPWCRYICPVGMLLSLFNRFSVFSLTRDDERCNECYACSTSCRFSLPSDNFSSSMDCIRCLSCYLACSHDALRFQQASFNIG